MSEDFYDDDDTLVAYSTIRRTIIRERLMTKEEMDELGWSPDYVPTVLELDDGTTLIPAADPELEGPGAIYAFLPSGKKVLVE